MVWASASMEIGNNFMNEEHSLTLSASPELAARELRRLRRHGWRSPADHVVVEVARLVLIVVPATLWLAGLIGNSSLLGYLFGYFAMRWFQKYLKPRILLQFGPVEWRHRRPVEAELVFDSFGLRSVTPSQEIRLGWSKVPVSKVGDGMIFRVGPEMSFVVTTKLLPTDWTMSRFEAAITLWRTQEKGH